jgi:hypothetical protein
MKSSIRGKKVRTNCSCFPGAASIHSSTILTYVFLDRRCRNIMDDISINGIALTVNWIMSGYRQDIMTYLSHQFLMTS